MEAFSAFSAKGRWYRGNCHVHTNLSDGKPTPEKAVEAYCAKGYDFLVLTDHDTCHPDPASLQRKGFLVINGAELHPPAQAEPQTTHHLIAIGIDKAPDRAYRKTGTAASVIRWIKRAGGIPVYCHPYWTGHNLDHLKEGRNALGMEAYNTTCQIGRGRGDASVHLDQALAQKFHWTVFAVDDAHSHRADAFRGWIMVKARQLTRKAIMDAIRSGRFYATTGPAITALNVKGNVARVACSPVKEIVWHCASANGGSYRIAGKRLLTGDEHDVTTAAKGSPYVRVEITDSKGRKAWSNPIWYHKRTRQWVD